ncbi:MAG TPA: helix-turn-helix transcriptional regulator [Actinophytocola sp.]|uniref:helix-turn-helix domain-containing protein n=1 Tax=Actinophytocola sp. TaxID=1872138 RepID=UPI002DDCCF32|nr:helix-turn-helix transcriptional regulator [Actinophytocola sp.]HEV2784611.1 helix-turn-helix transcriptional regulator [Actinophytocola sp.]
MNINQKPPFLRRRVGNRLRTMREAAGLSLEEAAPRLDLTRSSLHRVETGATRATVHLIRSMMDLYDCYTPELLDQAREALKPTWYPQQRKGSLGYVGLEDSAATVREFCGLSLPGLLQTEPYIRALFDRDLTPRTAERLEEDVAVRIFRQRRLTDEEEPLEFIGIVDEAALHRELGGAEVMRDQLKHMVAAASLPTVTLQVLRLCDGAHNAMNGSFTLLDFPDEHVRSILFVDYMCGSLHIEDADQIRAANRIFEGLRDQALSPTDSVDFIGRVLTELDNR